MWCTSGCAPVAIEERQTGVSDGNVETARRYCPSAASRASVGADPVSTACSNTAGVSPSMTTTISFLSTRKDPKAGVPLARAPPQARSEGRHCYSFEVTDERDRRQRRDHQRADPDQDRGAAPRSAAAEGAAHELRGAEYACES